MDVDGGTFVPSSTAAQLAVHAKLAAHYAATAGAEPAAAEAILTWAVIVASGVADASPPGDATPTPAEVREDAAALPAWRAAADQAEQLVSHFDDEELFDLASLYGVVLSVIESEIQSIGEEAHR